MFHKHLHDYTQLTQVWEICLTLPFKQINAIFSWREPSQQLVPVDSSFCVYKHFHSQPCNSQFNPLVCFYPRSAKPLFPGAFAKSVIFHCVHKLSKSNSNLSLFLPELSKTSVSRFFNNCLLHPPPHRFTLALSSHFVLALLFTSMFHSIQLKLF